ncbi:dephospho-CoA kinase [Tractidigestivibacter scatoligenes]|uniref:Dephospho-CoA kinase n=1 Tax=Tractidigestivibacter scatoligenes TaxID=1299998 RepID=A0A100YXJ5_TRASO|nr:dephospho-CoA kinase [Tractidigestivibacter scatoligenes]KUH59541.1 dephospho-CoA kinase [Tractidigestivibacter scatoligenes]
MYKVFLAGGIASGKSTVARILEGLGASRIDLDQVSRSVLSPRSDCSAAVAKAFGEDLVNPTTGEINRALLAKRAFATSEGGARLEAIELPFISETLAHALAKEERSGAAPVCVVEVPLLDRVEAMLSQVDEVLSVVAPLDVRRVRAQGRGMDAADFDRRVALQPSDEYLRSHADVVFENAGDEKGLAAQVRAWWDSREREGWVRRAARGCGVCR